MDKSLKPNVVLCLKNARGMFRHPELTSSVPLSHMPQFIHLDDDRERAMIRKNGIKAQYIFGRAKGVYATPVLQNYY